MMAGTRPGGVTLIAVLTWINGALGIVSGILGLIGGNGHLGIIALVIGVATLAVGIGLLNGSNVARILATIVFVLSLGAAILALVSGGSVWSSIVTGALSLIALVMLYTARSNEFFRA